MKKNHLFQRCLRLVITLTLGIASLSAAQANQPKQAQKTTFTQEEIQGSWENLRSSASGAIRIGSQTTHRFEPDGTYILEVELGAIGVNPGTQRMIRSLSGTAKGRWALTPKGNIVITLDEVIRGEAEAFATSLGNSEIGANQWLILPILAKNKDTIQIGREVYKRSDKTTG